MAIHICGSSCSLQRPLLQQISHLAFAGNFLLCGSCQADAAPRDFPDMDISTAMCVHKQQVSDLLL